MSVLKSTACFLVMVSALAGCKQVVPRPSLVPDATLQPLADKPGVLESRGTPLHATEYRRILVEPVTLIGEWPQTQETTLLAQQFRREMVVRLANEFDLVDYAGAGVLRLNASMVRPHPSVNATDLRGHTLELRVTDSVTHELILALADTRPHSRKAGEGDDWTWDDAQKVLRVWAHLVRTETAKSR